LPEGKLVSGKACQLLNFASGIEFESSLGSLLTVSPLHHEHDIVLIQQPAQIQRKIELDSIVIPLLDLKLFVKGILVIDPYFGIRSRVTE
jgi:hypothetical protein